MPEAYAASQVGGLAAAAGLDLHQGFGAPARLGCVPHLARSYLTHTTLSALAADPFSPREIALRVEALGVRKTQLPLIPTMVLGVLGGAFIAFGAMLYTAIVTDSALGAGPTRLLGGAAFSLGLLLVVVAGAELFTGNNLIAMAWASGKVSTRQMLRNWGLVYLANFAGALGAAMLMWLADGLLVGGEPVRATAIEIARIKLGLDPMTAFARGVLCNILVCLAVWLCFAARDLAGKLLAILPPVSAFVALGFEHSVANMYLIPVAWLAGAEGITLSAFAANLAAVTLGNILGGSGLVALVYWLCYLRDYPAP